MRSPRRRAAAAAGDVRSADDRHGDGDVVGVAVAGAGAAAAAAVGGFGDAARTGLVTWCPNRSRPPPSCCRPATRPSYRNCPPNDRRRTYLGDNIIRI